MFILELRDTGWDMLVACALGPSATFRAVREPDPHGMYALCDGGLNVHVSEGELLEIEDGINAYLAALSLPPRPAGYRWFVALPRRLSRTEITQTLGGIAGSMHPPFVAPCAPGQLDELCRRFAESIGSAPYEGPRRDIWCGE